MIKKLKALFILSILLIAFSVVPILAATPTIPVGVTPASLKVERADTKLWVGDTIKNSDLKVTMRGSDGNDYVLDATEFTIDTADKEVKMGTNTFQVSYGGVTQNISFTGHFVNYLYVGYNASPVLVGSKVKPSDVSVKAATTEEDGTTTTLHAVTDWTVDGTDNQDMTITGSGDNNFTIRYGNATANITVKGTAASSTGGTDPSTATLTAVYANESVQLNENFDKEKVTVTYNDGTTSKTVPYELLDVKPTNTRVTTLGYNNFTIGYKGKTATLQVHGFKVDSIDATYSGGRIKVGSSLNKDKLKVRLHYTENLQGLPDPTILTKKQYTVTPATAISSGSTKFTITYDDDYDYEDISTEIVVDSYATSDLTIASMEAKYKEESVLVGNDFNTSDVTIEVKYSDGSIDSIGWSKLDKKPTDIKVSKAGWNSFELGYGDATATLQVHGYEVSGIVAEWKGGDVAVGSSIDKSKLVVKVTYTKNYKDETVTSTISDYTLSTDKVNVLGANTITVTAGDKTTTFNVNGVAPGTVSSGNFVTAVTNGARVVAKTGDSSSILSYVIVLLLVVTGCIAGYFVYKRYIKGRV